MFAVRTPVRYPATEQAPLDVRVFMTKTLKAHFQKCAPSNDLPQSQIVLLGQFLIIDKTDPNKKPWESKL